MKYRIYLTRRANRELKRLSPDIRERIEEKIEELSSDPLPRGAAKLVGLKDAYRVRVGDYRILYRVYWKERMVVVFRIAMRKKAYRAL
ncbi:MAG: type II toxin-antitoxin system RelE/ParE family toxin [Thermoprotei archaeon]|nr:MAG: type II toxin-antitoxin system RelE/ParE family toxin [Thermoprotei archaeon]HDM27001.1 type II toxin-antitoxin system RelE/ParE family toxin [Candidatus Bathyarchaeota archaeon]